MTRSNKPINTIRESSILIHSFIQNVTGVSENVIIEYTNLNFANDIGKNSIVSNCVFPSGVKVPENSFLHTVVLCDEGEPLYVTIAFGIEDNLKKCCKDKADAKSLMYAGIPLDDALDKLHLFYVSCSLYLFVNIFVFTYTSTNG